MKSAILTGINLARQLLNKAESKLVEQDLSHPKETAPDLPKYQEEIPFESSDEPTEPTLSTFEDRAPMNDLLRAWGRVSGQTFKELKARVRLHADVARIDFMTKEQVKETCRWIERNIAEAKNSVPKQPGSK